MPKTTTRYSRHIGLRVEPVLLRKIQTLVRREQPAVTVTEWIRRVLWSAVISSTQQPKEN
jgi:hypothetical protein